MQTLIEQNSETFYDRRSTVGQREDSRENTQERRQFRSTQNSLRPDAQELQNAVDAYKAGRHRRFINFEELLDVMNELGYRKFDNFAPVI